MIFDKENIINERFHSKISLWHATLLRNHSIAIFLSGDNEHKNLAEPLYMRSMFQNLRISHFYPKKHDAQPQQEGCTDIHTY